MTKETKLIAKGSNFTAMDVGKFEDVKDYSLGQMKGKIFLKDLINSTGVEMSFTSLPANTELPFYHKHKQNEEVYIVVKGNGWFQVDNEKFPIQEGSVIRVATEGKRIMGNDSKKDLVYIVIQVKEKSLSQYTGEDGVIINK